MANQLSEHEIQELLDNGATVESDNKELSLAGMAKLLEQMSKLVEAVDRLTESNKALVDTIESNK